jgi:hypothetical protein
MVRSRDEQFCLLLFRTEVTESVPSGSDYDYFYYHAITDDLNSLFTDHVVGKDGGKLW